MFSVNDNRGGSYRYFANDNRGGPETENSILQMAWKTGRLKYVSLPLMWHLLEQADHQTSHSPVIVAETANCMNSNDGGADQGLASDVTY
jgi:hypothetical protein